MPAGSYKAAEDASDVWVIVPTYDEAENVGTLVDAALTALSSLEAPLAGHLLIVDDDSPDGTGVVADELASQHSRLEVLHRPRKAGIAAAYAAGMTYALRRGAAYVCQMDADGSHDAADLPRLIMAAHTADVALGSRWVAGGAVEGWPLRRHLLSRFGGAYASAALGMPIRDPTGGFKCFRAAALRSVGLADLRGDGYVFQVETTYRALCLGLRVVEVPILFRERVRGRSKLTSAIAFEAAWRTPLLRWSVPAARPSRPDPRTVFDRSRHVASRGGSVGASGPRVMVGALLFGLALGAVLGGRPARRRGAS